MRAGVKISFPIGKLFSFSQGPALLSRFRSRWLSWWGHRFLSCWTVLDIAVVADDAVTAMAVAAMAAIAAMTASVVVIPSVILPVLPAEWATAVEFNDVDSRSVMAGGVTTAN